jgi:hypothetical protein
MNSHAGCYEYEVNKSTKVQTELVSKIPLEYRSRTQPCINEKDKRTVKSFSDLSVEDQKFINELIRLRFIKKEDLKDVNLNALIYVFRADLIKSGADPDNLDAPPNPRLVTPEETLKTFLNAIQHGDLPTALLCLDPTRARVFNAQYKSWGQDKMWNHVANLWPIEQVQKHPDMAEYRTVKKRSNQNIVFVNVFGNWKIAQY